MAGLELWDLGPYPMACVGVGRIRGDLLTLDEDSYELAMARVDALEGVDPVRPEQPGRIHYWRERRTAILPGCGGPLPEAWVYLSEHIPGRRGVRIASSDWWQADGGRRTEDGGRWTIDDGR
jgi:gamma-glutamylcyclotransferase (GGCT)/AIG2-like uncharacterized protein YtfP